VSARARHQRHAPRRGPTGHDGRHAGPCAGTRGRGQPAAKKCKKGTVLIKTGRKKRCVKLRVAPPPPKAADRGQLAIDLLLPSGDAPARITWHQRPLTVGDVAVTPSGTCFPIGANGPLPDPVTMSAARDPFLDPGPHTIALDAPATVSAIGDPGTISSTAHYALTFERVNEDGSRYTG